MRSRSRSVRARRAQRPKAQVCLAAVSLEQVNKFFTVFVANSKTPRVVIKVGSLFPSAEAPVSIKKWGRFRCLDRGRKGRKRGHNPIPRLAAACAVDPGFAGTHSQDCDPRLRIGQVVVLLTTLRELQGFSWAGLRSKALSTSVDPWNEPMLKVMGQLPSVDSRGATD